MLETILSIIFAVFTAAGAVFSYYMHIKNKLKDEALKAINSVEGLDLVGEEKKKLAVESVYSIVPAIFKPFITIDVIDLLVQFTFDEVEEFAKKQVKSSQ